MGAYRFTNNAESTLAGALTAGGTSLTVVSAAAFPTAGNFTIIVGSEIMLVTGVAGTTFTVARAQEGTSATAHAAGTAVLHVVTADALMGGLVPRGTSFPTNPSASERFYRTDRNLEYFYNGTRWLTTTLYSHDIPIANEASAAVAVWGTPWSVQFDQWVESFELSALVATTNNPANYWTVTLQKYDAAVASQMAVLDTSSGTAGQAAPYRALVAALLLTTTDAYRVLTSAVGTPGTFSGSCRIVYRLVG